MPSILFWASQVQNMYKILVSIIQELKNLAISKIDKWQDE